MAFFSLHYHTHFSSGQYQMSWALGQAAIKLHKKVIPHLHDFFDGKPENQKEYLRTRVEVSVTIKTGLPISCYLELVQCLGEHLLTHDGFKQVCNRLGFKLTYKYVSIPQWLSLLGAVDLFVQKSSHLYYLAKPGHAIDHDQELFQHAHRQWRMLLNLIGYSNISIQKAITREATVEELLTTWQKDFRITQVPTNIWQVQWTLRFVDQDQLNSVQQLHQQVHWSYNSSSKCYFIRSNKKSILFAATSATDVLMQAYCAWDHKKTISLVYATADAKHKRPNIVFVKI